MATPTFPRDDRIGLVLAIALHAAVLSAVLFGRGGTAPPLRPEPVSVTISDELAPTSTAPHPAAQAAPPNTAPQIGEPAPPAPEPVSAPVPEPLQRPMVRKPAPPLQAPPTTKRAEAAPAQKPIRADTARPAASGQTPTTVPPKRAGASRIGADFLKGLPNAPATAARGQPAAAVGPAPRSALSGAIARQLKPNWTAPQGAEAELLVTILTWDLDANGRLNGKPRVVSQQGITDANRSQASRHAEQAIRAVELAAPFDLPAQYYAAWRHVAAFRFDRKLSQ